MAKDALTVLRDARELISDPKRWTKGYEARDRRGDTVWAGDKDAVCWCALGAVARATGRASISGIWSEAATHALDLIAFKTRSVGPAALNDRYGHEAVLAMFDAAIASAEKEAGNAVQA